MPKRKGGSLQADQIQKVLENTYKETDDAPSGYMIDKDLSDDRAKVYKDMNSDQVIVAHRGSKGWRDWLDNARYAYDGDITKSGTYKEAKARQQKAIDKYGAKNIISVGHSRAGKYVEELNKEQPVKEVITYNKAVHPNTIFQSNPENQTDVRTSTDIVSALSPLQFNKNKTVTIPSGYDLLKAHKPSMLSYLGNKLIGKGFKQMRVADMRKFVKAYKKEKYGEKMTGGARLGKKELAEMMNPMLEDDDLDEMVGGNVWTDFVKEFSARHNLKYACSLSKYKEALKKAYKLSKEGKDWFEPLTGKVPAPEPEPDPAPQPEPEKPKPKYKKGMTEDEFVEKYDEDVLTNHLVDYYPKGYDYLVKIMDKSTKRKPIDVDLVLSKGIYLPISTVRKLVLKHGLIPTFKATIYLIEQIATSFIREIYSGYNVLIDTIITASLTLKAIGELSEEEMEQAKKGSKSKPIDERKSKAVKARTDDVDLDEEGTLKERVAKRKDQAAAEPEPESPMQDMEYKPKMTREMRFQMEKALRESTKHLPPLRSKREDALIAQQVPALKGILKGLQEKTTGLKRQAMIDRILQREGIVKGAVFDDPSDYKQLEEQYKIRRDSSFLLDGLTFTNIRSLLAKLRDDLKEQEQAGERRKAVNTKTDIDRYTEELKKLQRLSKMDQYLIKKVKTGMVGGNRWTDFVKDYAKKDNTTYGCALSDAGTKNAYKLFKDGKPWYFPKAETKDDFVDPMPIPAPVNIEPVVNRIEEKVKELEKLGREEGAVSYDADAVLANIAFVNLMKKYNSKCIIANVDTTYSKGRPGIVVNSSLVQSTTMDAGLHQRLGEALKNCIDRGVQLINIPLALFFGKKDGGHANMLVYRPFQRLIERFEPHGRQYGNSEKGNDSINKQLKKLFEVYLTPYIGEVTFRDPEDICPNPKGFQSLESSLKGEKEEGLGFCSMWSIFLTEMTMLNPLKSTKEIIDEVMDLTKREPAYLKSIIRGYVLEVEKGLDALVKLMGRPGFRMKDRRSTMDVYELKNKLDQWLIDAIFDTGKFADAPPEYQPLPGVLPKIKSDQDAQIEIYRKKLNPLTKAEVDNVYGIFGAKSPKVPKAEAIKLLVGWIENGTARGTTGLKDIDVILAEELHKKIPPYKFGMSQDGYFKNK